MLTNGELQYLQSQGVSVRTRATKEGRIIVGGDAQYAAQLADVNAVNDYKTWVKDEASARVDAKITEKYPRASNPRYQAKHREALIYKEGGYTGTADDFQYLKEEATQRGITLAQMADLIISATNTYNANVATVERRRVQFNADLDAATTLDQVYTLFRNAEIAIEGL